MLLFPEDFIAIYTTFGKQVRAQNIKSLMIALALVDIKPSRTPPQRKKSESIIMKVTQDELVGPSLSTHHH